MRPPPLPPKKPDVDGIFRVGTEKRIETEGGLPWFVRWVLGVAIAGALGVGIWQLVTADLDTDTPATLHLRDGRAIDCADASSILWGKAYSCDTTAGDRRSYPLDSIEFVEWRT